MEEMILTEENRSKAETDVRDSQPTRKDIIDKVLAQQDLSVAAYQILVWSQFLQPHRPSGM